MDAAPVKPRRSPPRGWRRVVFDGACLLVYLSVVYSFSLTLHPLGRDYVRLGNPSAESPLVAWALQHQIEQFGGNALPYHLVNLALLYAATLLVYTFVRLALPANPIWHGTLAGTLFMAHPAHSDGVLHVTAAVDLIPALFGIGAISAHALHQRHRGAFTAVVAVAAIFSATLLFYDNLALPLACLVLWWLLRRPEDGVTTTFNVGLVALQFAALGFHRSSLSVAAFDPADMFVPLYFLFYPIGFLPETVSTFQAYPILGWIAAGVVIGIVVFIYKSARHPAILAGPLAACAFRMGQGGEAIDPVHLIGGGRLLTPTVLFCLALVTVFGCIMRHPKWRRATVSFTTLLCIFFFGMEIRVISAWRHVGEYVEYFQHDAAEHIRQSAEGVVGVVPDYQCYRGAPMFLSESIEYTTPFSAPIPHESLLRMHYDVSDRLDVHVESYSAQLAVVAVEYEQPRRLLPPSYSANEDFDYEIVESPEALRIAITPRGDKVMPKSIAPLSAPVP